MADLREQVERAMLGELRNFDDDYGLAFDNGVRAAVAAYRATIERQQEVIEKIERWFADELSALNAAHERMQEIGENTEAYELGIQIDALERARASIATMRAKDEADG